MDLNFPLNDGAHEEIEDLQQNYWVDEIYQLTKGRFKSNSEHNSISQQGHRSVERESQDNQVS